MPQDKRIFVKVKNSEDMSFYTFFPLGTEPKYSLREKTPDNQARFKQYA